MNNGVLALDVGASTTRLRVEEPDTGEELARKSFPTRGHDFAQAMREITAEGREFAQIYSIRAVAAGVAGVVEDGVITGSGNLPDWVDRNVQAYFSTAFGLPTVVENDCKMAALGEFTKLNRALFYVIWGSGVGGTEVDAYGNARATEFGHIIIDHERRLRCGCGGYGHLEAHVGGKGIAERYGYKAEMLHNGQWAVVIQDMAIGLRSLSAVQMGVPVVLGGGIAIKQAHRLPELQKRVNELRSTCPAPELFLAACGEDGGLIGAGYAARRLVAA